MPRVVDLTSFGGTVRRYEVQPDPDRLRRYGITLLQLQATLNNANTTVGGDYVSPGPDCHDGAEHRPFWRRIGPGEQGAGDEERCRRRRHAPRRGTAADPGNPQPGHHLGQQPADPRRRRGRGGTASVRAVARRKGRGRQQPHPAGASRLLQRRPRATVGIDPDLERHRSRRRRQGAVHRAHVEGRRYDARLDRHQGQGRRDQQTRIGPVVARHQDRALLRPDRPAPPDHRDGDRKPVPGRRARRRDPVHVREQYPDGDHCRHQHSAGAFVRLHRAFPARQVGEPALDRGGRFRHHRRFLGGRGRKRLPQPGLGQPSRLAPQGADQALRARDRPCALVFHPDHGVRLRAAICHVRGGGTALPADGADLRVLAWPARWCCR